MIKKMYAIYLSAAQRWRDPQQKGVFGVVRKYVSPLFIVMLLVAATLWYITKLGYSYTTELSVNIQIEDATFKTTYVAEGVGFKLLGYNLYKKNWLKIPLKELKYKVTTNAEKVKQMSVDHESLLNAIAVRHNDIKITSMAVVPTFEVTDKLLESINKR